jgi:hypothetical protein
MNTNRETVFLDGSKRVGEPPQPEFSEGFEDGSVADSWEIGPSESSQAVFTAVQDRTHSGSWAVYSNDPSTEFRGRHNFNLNDPNISWAEYWYNETSSSTGHAVTFTNSNGNLEFATSSNNPQWGIYDGNGNGDVDGGTTYNNWIYTKLVFYWNNGANGTVDVEFHDPQAGKRLAYRDRPLKQGVDIASMEVYEQNNGNLSSDADIQTWFDDITVSTEPLAQPTNLKAPSDDPNSISLTWDGEDIAYDLYRSETSGSVIADYDAKSIVDFPDHTVNGLVNGRTYYFRVTNRREGNDGLTQEVSRTTDLPPIENLGATENNDSIDLYWDKGDNNPNGEYDIYRSTDGSFGSLYDTITDLSQTSYTDTNVSDGTDYTYHIDRETSDATAPEPSVTATPKTRTQVQYWDVNSTADLGYVNFNNVDWWDITNPDVSQSPSAIKNNQTSASKAWVQTDTSESPGLLAEGEIGTFHVTLDSLNMGCNIRFAYEDQSSADWAELEMRPDNEYWNLWDYNGGSGTIQVQKVQTYTAGKTYAVRVYYRTPDLATDECRVIMGDGLDLDNPLQDETFTPPSSTNGNGYAIRANNDFAKFEYFYKGEG